MNSSLQSSEQQLLKHSTVQLCTLIITRVMVLGLYITHCISTCKQMFSLFISILCNVSPRVLEDLGAADDGKVKLLTDNEECTPALIHLLTTGRAVRHYHNGNVIYDKDGHLLVRRIGQMLS